MQIDNLETYQAMKDYTDAGIVILPLMPPDANDDRGGEGKMPLVWKWQKKKLATPSEIEGWHEKFGDKSMFGEGLNVGLTLGRTNKMVCFDIDARNGGLAWYEENKHLLTEGVHEMTGRNDGSRHIYYGCRFAEDTCVRTIHHNGVDFLAEGAQVVVAPSIHSVTGKKYEWVEDDLIDSDIKYIEDDPDLWKLVEELCGTKRDRNNVIVTTSTLTTYERDVLLDKMDKMESTEGRHNTIGGWIHDAVGAGMDDGEITEHARRWLDEQGRGEEQPSEIYNWIVTARRKLADGDLGVDSLLVVPSLIAQDERVQIQQRIQGYDDVLGPIDESRDNLQTSPPLIEAEEAEIDDDGSFLLRLRRNPNSGQILQNDAVNLRLIIQHHPELENCLYWNTFTANYWFRTPPPWDNDTTNFPKNGRDWRDEDEACLLDFISETLFLEFNPTSTMRALKTIRGHKRVHPPQLWIRSLAYKWDGIPRIHKFLAHYCQSKAVRPEYLREVSMLLFVSMIARIMDPGCKVDNVVVLESTGQGENKSAMIKALGDPYNLESIPPVGTKDCVIAIQGRILTEVAEGHTFTRAESGQLKDFISRQNDDMRAPYDKTSSKYPRQGIFMMTTNETHYLKDPTGDRRFLPVPINGTIKLDEIIRDKEQFFAEAYQYWRRGRKWWITNPEMKKMCEAVQTSRYELDTWTDALRTYITAKKTVELVDLVEDVFDKKATEMSTAEGNRITRAMKFLGWHKRDKLVKKGERSITRAVYEKMGRYDVVSPDALVEQFNIDVSKLTDEDSVPLFVHPKEQKKVEAPKDSNPEISKKDDDLEGL